MKRESKLIARFTEPRSAFHAAFEELIGISWPQARRDVSVVSAGVLSMLLDEDELTPNQLRLLAKVKRLAARLDPQEEPVIHIFNNKDALSPNEFKREIERLIRVSSMSKRAQSKSRAIERLLDRFEIDQAKAIYNKNKEHLDSKWFDKCLKIAAKRKAEEIILDHFATFNFDAAKACYEENEWLIQTSWFDAEFQSAKQALQKEVDAKELRRKMAEEEKTRKQAAAKAKEQLQSAFERNFLTARFEYEQKFNEIVSRKEFHDIKRAFLEDKMRKWLDFTPDENQMDVIGWDLGNLLVTARAGSGKTSTIVNRVFFLIHHCGVDANSLLVLAFNRKARTEVKAKFLQLSLRVHGRNNDQKTVWSNLEEKKLDQLAARNGITFPHVMTFHALARSVVLPDGDIIYDDSDGGNLTLSRAVQRMIDDRLHLAGFEDQLKRAMLSHFREDWERIALGRYSLSPEDYLRYRRSLTHETLAGDFVKSHGEKVIANLLFEHDVPYQYERAHYFDGIPYRPDFTVPLSPNSGLIIEYFGLAGKAAYDRQTQEKIKYWEGRKNWVLYEVYPKDIPKGPAHLWAGLRQKLANLGGETKRLSEEEIWEKVRERSIDSFSRTVVMFIGRAQKKNLSPEQMISLCSQHQEGGANTYGEREFAEIACQIYSDYLAFLQQSGDTDFDRLLFDAADKVKHGKTIFRRVERSGDLSRLNFIFIDEYQDFSKPFSRLMSAVTEVAPQAQVTAVGDDWQAINAFAGSDLQYFHGFEKEFPGAERRPLLYNYRSDQAIVQAGNAVMSGLGKKSESKSQEVGRVAFIDLGLFSPNDQERAIHKGDVISPLLLRLIQEELKVSKGITLLTRRRTGLPFFMGGLPNLESLPYVVSMERKLRNYFDENDRHRISVHNAHQFKGREDDAVIIVDAVERSYPLIHPNWVFFSVFGDSPYSITDEERRLFYVAVTRARMSLYIVTEGGSFSPFCAKIQEMLDPEWIDVSSLPALIKSGSVFILQVGNALDKAGRGGTFDLRFLLKSAGYRWSRLNWPCWQKRIRNIDALAEIKNELWVRNAEFIEVRVVDSEDKVVYKARVDKGTWVPH